MYFFLLWSPLGKFYSIKNINARERAKSNQSLLLIDMDTEALVQFMCHYKESKRFYSWDSLFSFLYWGWGFVETGHYKICGFQIQFYFNFYLNVIGKNKLHRWKRHSYKDKSHHNISMDALTLNQSPDIRQNLNFGYIKFIDIK